MDTVVIVVAFAAVMIAIERVAPGVAQPTVPRWIARVAALNALQVGVVYLGAWSWDRWLPQFRLFDSDALPPLAGTLLGYLAITFVFYWWHRARHEVPLLWRLHQVHHSPARIEVVTSFYKHPLEIAINGVLCSTVLYVLIGLSPETAATVVAITGVAELVYHWNVRTPHWLGWFFQRPEMHRRHHERGWHRNNYSDLPIWDLLFGTFDNPRETPPDCGFESAQERQLGRMLLGEDAAMKTKSVLICGFLVALGSLQMLGDVLGAPRLKAFAAATQVAPAMKVFTAHQGYETHAARFTLHWQDASDVSRSLVLDPHTYRRVEGPYNRRNVYGAALAYGPVLREDPRTQALQQSVMAYAFCAPGTLRDELGIPSTARDLRLEVAPTRADARRDLDLVFSVNCDAH